MPERDDRRRRRRLLGFPWMPWRIYQGRQVPGPDTPRDNEDRGNPYCVHGDHGDRPFHETSEHRA